MISKITHITLFVSNQDEALKFYTEKLGFQIHTDAQFDDMRWLTLNFPDQDDVELVLMLAENEQEKKLVGKQAGEKPFLSLQTTDCAKDYEKLSKAGVKFLDKPQTEAWGSACMLQDLYGNRIYICQPNVE